MNFEDEPYVRLFIRRTLNNKRLRWEGRAVMHEMLYVFDRAGVFEFDGELADAIETMTELPSKVVKLGLKRLLDAKTWVVREGVLFWPNYLVAQTASRSDKARQQESRQRRRDTAHAQTILGTDAPEQAVTACDDESHGVTDETQKDSNGHSQSQVVTPSLAVPSRAEQEREIPPTPRSRPEDPLRDSLTGRRSQDDPGVIAVFEAWKLAHGFTGAKFRQPADYRADTLFEAVKTHGVEDCLRVLEASKTDAMVTGKADEQGQEHRSIEYLFKPATFDRLLRAADKQRAVKPLGAAEAMRRARLA